MAGRRKKIKMSKGEAILLLVLGILLGNVFLLGELYWNKAVEPQQARPITADYESFKESYGRGGSSRGIYVRFYDYEPLDIDGCCVNSELRSRLEQLEPGTKLEMLVHPNSDTILDMRSDSRVLLEFEQTRIKLAAERRAFAAFGLFFYLTAACGLVRLISIYKNKRK